MRYLYVDNFRGFANTSIPIDDVNFLVGENSTGKTSILALMAILGTPNFWFSQDFNLESHELGDFKDLVSVAANDKSMFHVGHCETHRSETKDHSRASASLMTFKEEDGRPNLCSYVRLEKNKIVTVAFQSRHLAYRVEECRSEELVDGLSADKIFSRLKQNYDTHEDTLQQLNVRFAVKSIPLPIALSIVDQHIEGKDLDINTDSIEMPFILHDFAWLAPIRTKPRRTYDGSGRSYSPEGEHTPYLLRKQLTPGTDAKKFSKALHEFGVASGLFKQVVIKHFGKDTVSPFEVDVVLGKNPLSINSVGYGVSQALPIVVELLARSEHCWFFIQQPEVHLHPRAQAALGDLFFTLMEHESKRFLVETHSDFTIDRFRSNYRKEKGKKPSSQVLFFERVNGGNKVTPIPIMPNGEYSIEQPESFRAFFLKEQMDILGL